MTIIKTIGEWDYSRVDDRLLSHDGCIVDLGCDDWEFVKPFIGLKRIIGADPFGKPLEGATFYQGAVGTINGIAQITSSGQNSSTFFVPKYDEKTIGVQMVTWRKFCLLHSITSVSLLKLNIEGGEYPLLANMSSNDYARIDQIAVSFHNFIDDGYREATEAALHRLTLAGYSITKTADWGWYLALKT